MRLRHKSQILIFAAMLGATPVRAQTPQRIEYFLDTDPGYGLATTITNISVGNNTLTFDLSTAKEGAHLLCVRSRDDKGQWSAVINRPIFIDRLQDIVYVEYFFDTDPGMGKGTPVGLPPQEYKSHLDLPLNLDISALSLGKHKFSVRARDAFGAWTDVMSRDFTVVEGAGPDIPVISGGDLERIEYFFDTDPGYGKGFALAKPNTGENIYLMSFETLSDGAHLLGLRAADDKGNWSATLSHPIYVCAIPEVAAIEYFIDTDKGEGRCTAVPIQQETAPYFAFDVSTDELSEGRHQLCVRTKGSDGKWSVASSEPFEITRSGSGITAIKMTFQIGITASDGVVSIKELADSPRGNCRVEIFSINGGRIASASWAAGTPSTDIPVGTAAGNIIIVKVYDTQNNRSVVKRILCK